MRRLLLLGGGHAHVQVVRAFGDTTPPDVQVMLMNRTRLTAYSGMLPGYIAGHYTLRQSHIDLGALCAGGDVQFIEAEACALQLSERAVFDAAGTRFEYDLLSVDTGSAPPVHEIEGAAERAISIKPVERFTAWLETTIEALKTDRRCAIAVIGGGAAGVEVAFALDYRLRHALGSRDRTGLTVVTQAPCVLAEFPRGARVLAERMLRAQDIDIIVDAAVVRLDERGIALSNGRRLAADHVLFATGAAPAAMFARCGLQTDDRGFIAVSAALQSLSHPEVFACGDVAAVLEHPRPKAGVFAVRQGPPLAENLRRALEGTPLHDFKPQRRYLVLMSTGRKHAIATRNGWHTHGDWVWRWKDWIDRRFVAQFDVAHGLIA